jgi:3-deoxy-D-manno-octulosonic-acid transferase
VARFHPDIAVLLTCDERQEGQAPTRPGLTIRRADLPGDTPRAARWFLNLHKPDLCLWASDDLKPALLAQVHERGVEMILLDPDPKRLPSRRRAWFSDPVGQSVGYFDAILVRSDGRAGQMQRFPVPPARIRVTSPLRPGAFPPPCADADVAKVSTSLAGRPVWFAPRLPLGTRLKSVVEAQSAAVRLSHRLLLVIEPATLAEAGTYPAVLDKAGLRHAGWRFGEPIEDNTQVLVLRDTEDVPLWFRLAPLTFLSGAAPDSLSPMIAAALGSGVLFDSDPGAHKQDYDALVEAGAARRVRSPEALGQAVLELCAPDRAAAMALAGWEVVTEGAELANEAARLVGQRLEALATGDARP